MKNFEYYEPKTVQETLSTLANHSEDIKILAGGTDLFLSFLQGVVPPTHIVSLLEVSELSFIKSESEFLRIGPTTTLHRISESPEVRKWCRMLAESTSMMGSQQTRNLGTIGGNICNAVPSADTAPSLLAANAQVLIQSQQNSRWLPLTEFFKGPRKTVLNADELVVEIRIPKIPSHTGTVYSRHTLRKALDLSVVGVAVSVTLADGLEIIKDISIALGAVAPTPLRAREAEGLLIGKRPANDLLEEVAQYSVKVSRPIDDIRASSEYRKKLIRVLVIRCIEESINRAKSS